MMSRVISLQPQQQQQQQQQQDVKLRQLPSLQPQIVNLSSTATAASHELSFQQPQVLKNFGRNNLILKKDGSGKHQALPTMRIVQAMPTGSDSKHKIIQLVKSDKVGACLLFAQVNSESDLTKVFCVHSY